MAGHQERGGGPGKAELIKGLEVRNTVRKKRKVKRRKGKKRRK